MRTILVTGAAGFIGYHLTQRLLAAGDRVVGIDNLNSYYSVQLKKDRLQRLTQSDRFVFDSVDVADSTSIQRLFETYSFDRVVHLAAQAGVRYSLENARAYIDSNLVGMGNILEACRHARVQHLVYASSSSVYGANTQQPFSVHHSVDHPISLYAATKKSNELMAHAYSHLFQLPTTGLRFFTVYGPWGRPDMALFKFANAILLDRPIEVYNRGQMRRDFTFVDDIVEGMARVMDTIAAPNPTWNADDPDPATSSAPYRIYNIGNHQPVELMQFIHVLEETLGKKATMNLLPMQPGDVLATYADVSDLESSTGFAPSTTIEDGIKRFVDWFLPYRQSNPDLLR